MKKNRQYFWLLTLTAVLIGLGFSVVSAQNKLIQESDGRYESLKTKSLSYLRSVENIGSSMNLEIKNIEEDALSMYHARIRQKINDVPVWTGEAIVHMKADESLFAVTNDLKPDINVNTNPGINEKEASDIAVNLFGCKDCLSSFPKTDLWVMRHEGADYLVYRVQLENLNAAKNRSLPVYFIDAHTGSLVWNYDNLQTQSVVGTGVSLYSGTLSIKTSRDGCRVVADPYPLPDSRFNSIFTESSNALPAPPVEPIPLYCYYLEDIDRQVGTFNGDLTTNPPRFIDSNNYWSSAAQQAGVDAHWGMERTFDYFLTKFARNGINGFGGPALYNSKVGSEPLISGTVHVGTNYNNAYWTGTAMYFGDGNGVAFSPLVSVDVVGHEWTHGVTQYSAGLVYSGQSGALNESMSDVFGNMVERFAKGASANNWLVGEEVTTPGIPGDALRNMADPHTATSLQYDHYSETPFPGGGGCGVHTCSGVPNKVFYLLSQGGTHHLGGTVTGIGATKAEKIWYVALTSYMTSGTNFSQAKQATLNAAEALYGYYSLERQTVAEAWQICGVS